MEEKSTKIWQAFLVFFSQRLYA